MPPTRLVILRMVAGTTSLKWAPQVCFWSWTHAAYSSREWTRRSSGAEVGARGPGVPRCIAKLRWNGRNASPESGAAWTVTEGLAHGNVRKGGGQGRRGQGQIQGQRQRQRQGQGKGKGTARRGQRQRQR